MLISTTINLSINQGVHLTSEIGELRVLQNGVVMIKDKCIITCAIIQ